MHLLFRERDDHRLPPFPPTLRSAQETTPRRQKKIKTAANQSENVTAEGYTDSNFLSSVSYNPEPPKKLKTNVWTSLQPGRKKLDIPEWPSETNFLTAA